MQGDILALLIKTRLLGVSDVCLTVFLSTLNLKEEHLLEITCHVTRERMCLQYSGEGRGNLKMGRGGGAYCELEVQVKNQLR